MNYSDDSQFSGFEKPTNYPLMLKPGLAEAMLNLPMFKDVDIDDLTRLAEERLTYTRQAGRMSGGRVRGIEITDRAFAIAIIIGGTQISL